MKLTEYLTSIADALRRNLGFSSDFKIKATDFAEKINEVYNEAHYHGYEDGMDAEHNKFWDAYQQPKNISGAYNHAFYRWDEKCFYPKYDILPKLTTSIFNEFNNTGEPIDLIARLNECGVVFDSSAMSGVSSYTYYKARVTTIPTLNLSGGTRMECTFEGSTVEVIEKLILQTNLSEQEFRRTFHSCSNLREIRIENEFGQTVSFEHSPLLSVESLRSILTALTKDTAYASGKTLTLNSASQATVETDSECITQLTSVINAGWTINYI